MRSTSPLPGEPWPHDMVISVSSPTQLLELLWVREAHGLEPRGADLPPRLVAPPIAGGDAAPDQRARWQAAWPFVWDAALEHAALAHHEGAMSRLVDSPAGSSERRDLVAEIVGPTWSDRFGDEAFDDRWWDWSAADYDRVVSAPQTELEATPERRCLAALVPAWRAGLRTVITIPCRDAFTRIVGATGLLVTESTRDDPDRYAAALDRFARDAPRVRPGDG